MYGAQATINNKNSIVMFENDVEMYGAQANKSTELAIIVFENDVEMYGAQASYNRQHGKLSLRMM